jgi:HD-like signal output (HDOD) protein
MKRILIVDDDCLSLTQLRAALDAECSRWEVHTASSVEGALDLAASHSFDLILADCAIPGADGIAFLRHMREFHPQAARLLMADDSELYLTQRASAIAYRVLAKPLRSLDLIQTCERIFHLQDTFARPELRTVLGRIGRLQTLSPAYRDLNLAVTSPEVSTAEIAAIVHRDVAMTAKVLQLVNSGFFGLAQTLTSVHSAVKYLGIDMIRNLALASETFRLLVLDHRIPGTFLEELHGHAQRSAAIVATLPLARREREVAVVALLLQDVGELILASQLPGAYLAAGALMQQRKLERHEAEELLIGITHAELGAYLLGVWGIDAMTVEAVAHHHRPMRIPHNGLDTSAAVYLASLLASDLSGKGLTPADQNCLESLGLLTPYAMYRVNAAKVLAGKKA